jgi:hypothetical protein
MNFFSIILSDSGHFNLYQELLLEKNISINSISFRIDPNLINLFNLYGNKICKNCILRKENVPNEMLSKDIIIKIEPNGKEILEFYESNGDVIMKYW